MDRAALRRSQYWPQSKLLELKSGRLRRLLSNAQKLAFWADVFREADIIPSQFQFSDIERLPIITRADFRDLEEDLYISSSLKRHSFLDRTSGSTGVPFQFYVDRGAVLRSFAVRDRMFLVATGGVRYQILVIRAAWRMGVAFFKCKLFYLKGTQTIPERLPKLAEMVNRNFPEGVILSVVGSWALALAREVEKTNIRFPIRAISSGGEAMLPAEREYIEKTLDTKLFLTYASQENFCMAFECELHALHLTEEQLHIEIVDFAGRALPQGVVGRVVVTGFDNRVMPFIRYANGDIGSISAESCPCGRTLPTLSVVGREKDVIRLPDDMEVALMDISPIFNSFFTYVRQYQIVQKGPADFLVKVVVAGDFHAKKDDLTARLTRALHPSARIVWEIVSDIAPTASGKAVYFLKDF